MLPITILVVGGIILAIGVILVSGDEPAGTVPRWIGLQEMAEALRPELIII
jgi:phosphotransferase system  glucose/maltose/N-acetylglucosamine-specific IIC component